MIRRPPHERLRTLSPDQHHDTFLGALPHIIRGTLANGCGRQEVGGGRIVRPLDRWRERRRLIADLISQEHN